MNKKKIKILIVPSDKTGVFYFRSGCHVKLEELYPDEFEVHIDYQPKLDNDNFLKQYDIIHYHRTLTQAYDQMPALLDRIKALGIVTIMDIDDYWAVGNHHPAYLLIKNSGLDKMILNNIKIAHNVTTTTSIYADEIKKHNIGKNVFILPNAIDPSEKQYTPNPEKSDRIRIGWLGGSSHMHDLEILRGVFKNIKSDGLLDKVQFVLCGYDLRGMITMINEQTKEQTQRPITPKESVWYQYERIFTNDYQNVSPEYAKFLQTFKQEEYPNVENECYRRVWTKPISTYATNYNLFDVALAPVEEHIFNKVKSQLKVIEAGFHKKALIAQDFGPYQIDIKNAMQYGGGFDETANGILIETVKNHKDWYKAIKKLILNPELIPVLGNNLYNTVKDTYSIEAVCATRRDLYKQLVADIKKPVVEEILK
jgi:glycosyltransferase involved in cell wall biosynthesis